MPVEHAEQLVVDAQEEAYLRDAFRRFARPYLASMLVLVGAVWFLAGSQSPPPHPAAAAHENEQLRAEIAKLRAELESVHTLARRADRAASERPAPLAPDPSQAVTAPAVASTPEWKALVARLNAMTTRVQTLESRPAERVDRVVSHAGPPANADGLTKPLLDRLFNVETRQEKQEQDFRQTQKSMLNRVYAIESQRDSTDAERIALDQAALARMKNLEDRFYALEQAQSESLPASQR